MSDPIDQFRPHLSKNSWFVAETIGPRDKEKRQCEIILAEVLENTNLLENILEKQMPEQPN